MPYAHSRNESGARHDLVAHLRGVAVLARRFAEKFGAQELAYYAGLWHDLGKFHPGFQAYLRECEINESHGGHGPDHKAAGAELVAKYMGSVAALLIQGHHGGLRNRNGFRTWFAERTADNATGEALMLAKAAIPDLAPEDRLALPTHVDQDPRAGELFLRFLFSALVDADFLDTERHFSPERASHRGAALSIAELWGRFQRDQEQVTGQDSDRLARMRDEVYHACLSAAEGETGLYRLTVPTGGGKTRSAMAFALRHAICNDLERVIVAVPFISITEQTADTYRSIFEDAQDRLPVVLEHHSAAEHDESQEGDFHARPLSARLAAENWDARIVVTTTVQLFETLFSNRVSRTRKLHRMARSVIIVDEAQSLPHHLLTPILNVLEELCDHYGSTVVLSTATQPAFESIPAFSSVRATDIVPNSGRLFEALRRVDYEWRVEPALTWKEVADLLQQGPQALAVVNTKKDALALLDALDDNEALHLSTLLCGAHRRATIREVRRRLDACEPCCLVSTQVIEAGVDLDFPLVLRALAPLDSIIQAAGRCNRGGKLERGRVVVFKPTEGGMPRGAAYSIGTSGTVKALNRSPLDPDNPAHAHHYFQEVFEAYGPGGTDREGIQGFREALDYPQVAQRFRMIDDNTETVAITQYGSEEDRETMRARLGRLRGGDPEAWRLLRQLQPYLVNVFSSRLPRLQRQGIVTEVMPGLWEWHGDYHPVRGIGGATGIDPEALVF